MPAPDARSGVLAHNKHKSTPGYTIVTPLGLLAFRKISFTANLIRHVKQREVARPSVQLGAVSALPMRTRLDVVRSDCAISARSPPWMQGLMSYCCITMRCVADLVLRI